ncbi:MAG TPA: RNA polymerase sigma factor [Miltoncostaeaceae bacterium]|jgi:RNA polymerase sigma factor (sigma-70 family)|nr:RNA polymerase sigma factor [Miltoncostaeaceae bacterium]
MATTAPASARRFPPPAVLGDDALARRVGDGDEQAFEEVYRRYCGQLYRYCTSILGDRHEAEEALQSTMFNAYRALSGSRRDVALRPWLYRIAHNQCLDMLRRRREADELSGLEEQVGPRVEEQVAMREDLRQLSRDLAVLPAEQRAALMLREMSGLSHDEIATALDATPSAAKQLIHDARRNLMAFESGRRLPCAEVQRAISDGDGRVLRGSAIRAHLRACAECSLMRESIRERSLQLQSLFPPLAPAAAQAILASVGGGGGAGGGALAGAGLGGGGLAGGLAAKAAIVAATAVVGTAAIGIPLGLGDRVIGGGGDTPPAAAPVSGPAPVVLGGTAGSGASGGGAAAPRPGKGATGPGGRASGGGSGASAGAGAPTAGGVAAGAGAGPVRAGMTVDPASASAGAGASVAGGAVSAAAAVGGGSASVRGGAGPASAGAGADASSTSAGATVAAPPVSAGASAGPAGGGATVEAPGVTVEVPLPPVLP